MQVKCNDCGFTHVVGGLYPRRYGTRPQAGGKVPSEGRNEWGRYDCDGCGKLLMVPELEDDDKSAKGK